MQNSYTQQADALSNPVFDDHGMLQIGASQYQHGQRDLKQPPARQSNNLLKAAEHKFMVAKPVSKSQAR